MHGVIGRLLSRLGKDDKHVECLTYIMCYSVMRYAIAIRTEKEDKHVEPLPLCHGNLVFAPLKSTKRK